MPVGGFNVGTWDETVPASGEGVGLGDDRMRSIKTTLRQALDSEHVWAASGGTVGQHRYGSARAYYGPQSSVSASDTSVVADGRLMIASDTSRLFGVGSGGSVLFGPGPLALSLGSYVPVTFPQRLFPVVETGRDTSATSLHVVTFASAFSALPFLQVSAGTIGSGASNSASPKLLGLSATSFTCQLVDSAGQNGINGTVEWLAIGHRAL